MINSKYFSDAKTWYNDIYVITAYQRIVYLAVFVIITINCFVIYECYESFVKTNKVKKYVVIETFRKEGELIKCTQIENYTNNPEINIIYFLLERYITNRESLIYNSLSVLNTLQKKSLIVKNTSHASVFGDFQKEIYSNAPDSDMSFIITEDYKMPKIDSLEFFYDNLTKVQKVYKSFINDLITNQVIVHFTVDTKDKILLYKTIISFNFKLFKIKNINKLEFYVMSYKKELVDSILKT